LFLFFYSILKSQSIIQQRIYIETSIMLQFLKALIWGISHWATSDPSPSIGEDQEVSAQNLEAGILIRDILKIHKKLSVLHNLTPSAHINELFGELVGMCAETRSDGVTRKVPVFEYPPKYTQHVMILMSILQVIESQMIKDKLHSLRQICAQAEYELESYWAQIIVGCENSSGDEGTIYTLAATA
jgi:GTPase SAR1 family protein